ncbi:Cingulin [Bagarius yarrelli]|uniref:Cingulin n=1 Tax=Bagarius yarrelli TaxID=175774 RepID=A0A556U8Q8_BAGYA|nr:Cingulin [Bagarius yarrelli]
MSSLSADRKTPVDYGVQIRFIKDLDDMCGGYAERNRGVGGAGSGGGTSPSSSYGVAVRVQGISGHPYVVLNDGEKGDSYGVQLKSQPQTPLPGRSSAFHTVTPRSRDITQTPRDPYSSVRSPYSPEVNNIEFGSPLKRPPGDGQAGSHGDGATTENFVTSLLSKDSKKKDLEELNEAGLRPVRQNGLVGTLNGKRGNLFTSLDTEDPAHSAFGDEPAEAIDTKSLAPIDKLISKFNSSATSTMPSRIRGRSRARPSLQFNERKRSQSLDSRKENDSEPSLSPTLNLYAPGDTSSSSSLTSSKHTNYSGLGQSSPSIAKVPALSVSKTPTINKTTRMFVANEGPAPISNNQLTPEFLSCHSQSTVEAPEKQAIYEVLREGSVESEMSLRQKADLIYERYRGLKLENDAPNSRLQQQLDQTKKELQHAQLSLVDLRLEKERAESRCHQQQDQLAQLQEELRRVSESTPHSESLHMDLVMVQTELAETLMLKQKTEETLHMRERELTALKGALKDEVAAHDREMESQQEIEEERQKVNVSILTLEEELDGYREQGEHWKQQMTSVKQELLQAQQEKRELEQQLLSLKKEMCETDSHSITQELQRSLDNLQHARFKISEQEGELVKKNAELQLVKKASEDRELELQAEIEKLKEQANRENMMQPWLYSSLPNTEASDALEKEIRYLKMELEEARRTASRLNHEKEEFSRQLEGKEKERETLRKDKAELEEQRRLLDQTLEKINKDVEVLMGDSRQSVQTLQSQLGEFKERSHKELQDFQRLNQERVLELQRTQTSLKAAQDEMDQLRSELTQERSARHDLEMDKSALERQLSLRVKALKRQLDDSEGEVERLEGVRRKIMRDVEEHQELRDVLEAKISMLENELRRKVQSTRRPVPSSTLSSEEEDGNLDSKSLTSILTESQLQTTSC